MSIALIGIITFAIGAFSALRSSYWVAAALLCAALLGSASAISIGGASIPPGYLTVAFFALAVIIRPAQKDSLLQMTSFGRPGFLLLAVALWAVVSAVFMPRLFANQMMVYPLNATGLAAIPEPLRPVGSNLNQAVYALAGPMVFLLIAAVSRSPEALKRVAIGFVIASVLNLALAVIDMITFSLGVEALLDFIRNADYAQLFNQTIMGIKRITGAFPEPSSFAGASVILFAFNFRLWRGGILAQWTGPIALLTFFAIIFSFSSTGYGALIVYLLFALTSVLLGLENRDARTNVAQINRTVFIGLIPIVSMIAAIIVALRPELLDPVTTIFDRSLTSKLSSSSGVERSSWNMAGLEVFLNTFGLGAGTGSVRTSSFLVAVLANLGIIGAVFFGLFFYGLFFSRPEERTMPPGSQLKQYAAAGRAGCFIGLIASTVSASGFDLGIFFYACAGIACASIYYSKQPANTIDQAELPVMSKERRAILG